MKRELCWVTWVITDGIEKRNDKNIPVLSEIMTQEHRSREFSMNVNTSIIHRTLHWYYLWFLIQWRDRNGEQEQKGFYRTVKKIGSTNKPQA